MAGAWFRGGRAIFLSALAFMFCSAAAEPLRFGGTGTGTVLLQRLANDYLRQFPAEDIVAVSGSLGSTGAVRALAAGQIELAMVGRPLKVEEQNPAWRMAPWLTTPLVLASNGGVLAGAGQGLSGAQIESIWRGSLRTWDGGQRIRPVLRPLGESDNLTLFGRFPGLKAALTTALDDPSIAVGDTDLDALKLLEQIPGSLGTTTLGLLRLKESRLKVFAVAAAPGASDGGGALTKTLYLLHREPVSPALAQWLAWLRSKPVAQRLHMLGFEVVGGQTAANAK